MWLNGTGKKIIMNCVDLLIKHVDLLIIKLVDLLIKHTDLLNMRVD